MTAYSHVCRVPAHRWYLTARLWHNWRRLRLSQVRHWSCFDKVREGQIAAGFHQREKLSLAHSCVLQIQKTWTELDVQGDVNRTNVCVKFEGELKHQSHWPCSETEMPISTFVCENFTFALDSSAHLETKLTCSIIFPSPGKLLLTFLSIKQIESRSGTVISDATLMKRILKKGNN